MFHVKQSGTDIPPMIKFLYPEQAKIAQNEEKIKIKALEKLYELINMFLVKH